MLHLTTLILLPLLHSTLSADYLASTKQFSQPEIGLEEIETGKFNRLSIPIYQYTGECPGKQKGMVRVTFISNEIPPKQGRQVVIRNISSGLSETPHTDRDYNGEVGSQTADVTFGPGHDKQYLIVTYGSNTFEYDINQGNTTLKTGTFKVEVGQHTITEERYKTPLETKICPNTPDPCDWDEWITKTDYVCTKLPSVVRDGGWD